MSGQRAPTGEQRSEPIEEDEMGLGAGLLDGSVGVVTGGAGGIGAALVCAAEEAGAVVASLDVRAGRASLGVECDVTDEAEVANAVAEVERRLGPITFAVCAAGVVSETPVTELALAEWRRVVDVSLVGTFLIARSVVPSLAGRGGGRFVALSSGYATKGYRYGSHYAAAKAGVEAFVKSLALEVAHLGITVNAVAPGPVATSMLDQVRWAKGSGSPDDPSIPLGRVARPEDIVGPVLFLLGPGASHMTGQVLHVNGGILMP